MAIARAKMVAILATIIGLEAKIKRNIQSTGEFKVDSVAGASITSKAVSDAINNATLQ